MTSTSNGKSAPNKQTGTAVIERARRDATAIEMRIGGATLEDIKNSVPGFSDRGHVSRTIKKALAAHVSEAADEYRSLHIVRLEQLYMKFHSQAIKGSATALKGCLQILLREAKLLGLDAPTRTEVAGEILLRDIAGRAAELYGLDVNEVLAEAENILAETAD